MESSKNCTKNDPVSALQMTLTTYTMSLERGFNVRYRILQLHVALGITLRDTLHEKLGDPQHFLLAGLPHSNHYRSRNDAATRLRCRSLRGFRKVLLDPFEERFDVFPHVLGVVFLDYLLQSTPVVCAGLRYLRRRSAFQ